MRKIKCIVKYPEEKLGHIEYVNDELSEYQQLVSGYIECVGVGPGVAIIYNEEGRLYGYAHNCSVKGVDFVGTIIAVGTDGEEFTDVPFDLEEWKEWIDPSVEISPAFEIEMPAAEYKELVFKDELDSRIDRVKERAAAYNTNRHETHRAKVQSVSI